MPVETVEMPQGIPRGIFQTPRKILPEETCKESLKKLLEDIKKKTS